MLYLLLAIASSAIISILMRLGESQIKNTIAMFLPNYVICSVLSAAYMERGAWTMAGEGTGFAIGLGTVGGVLFLASFLFLKLNIRKNGIVLASTFMKLGVLVPTIMAMTLFHEAPGIFQAIGLVVAICAIVVISGGKTAKTAEGVGAVGILWLTGLLLTGGLSDSLANIFEQYGVPDKKDLFLLCIFLVASLLCVILLLVQKHRPSLHEILWGAVIGIPNYYSTRFLLLALRQVPAIFAYPFYNVAVLLIVTTVGILVFKEQMDKRKGIGLVMILAALVLLNL